jgi:electron transport complex protein RnfA
MELFFSTLIVALTAIVFENTIFTRAIGTSTMLIAAKNKKEIIPFGLSITYICMVSSALSFFADKFLLPNDSSELYMPFIYVLIIGFVYIVTLLIMWKWAYNLFVRIKKFVHMSAFNCAVLGALFLNRYESNSFLGYIVFGLGTGIGFFLASYLVSVSYEKLNSPKVPKAFRGFPITMIYIGIISMVFFVLTGNMPKI